ncbi:asparagine synthase-related protein [Occultella gossypii]|uniref:ATP-dependent sacrificial sulfur transferase LarE n=1 Tax=Occultella gossypii TaxID=2800820 RepID=A0ABS7S4D1_9MICO|nr:ATP-dependent sacrificial sulfur transferase LarE [Occultella gossypii]MBZ2195182.1 ATP-dependent sacrificial sulfur transferase LarE [Occultella gossypii]
MGHGPTLSILTPGQIEAGAQRVRALMAGTGPLGVAYSGGVDSTVLLALAVQALGADDVVAILGISPSLAADERTAAHEVADVIGARVVEVHTHEGENPDYQRNDVDRCFFCKDELFNRISDEVVAEQGLVSVAYGENADDAKRPDRPGAQAATNHRVLRPLAEAGVDKAMVRAIARSLGLPNADKPAAPCLASRIPHHQEVTPAKLGQVETVEAGLRRLGFTDSRVRHHGEIARLELLAEDIPRAAQPGLREQIQELVTGAGFAFAAVDLKGIQSGAFTMALVEGRGA